jgi:putative transposase
MARNLRYEAAGALYHVMARGDGGREVFEENKDRYDWLDRLGEVCGKYGWRVHAWVQMGNHFHILLETPEPNLVAGMKWFMGVVSQGWNRRRGRRGHVFQGRYKAVVVNGEDADGSYFKIVADYIHLNPVRSGWVGGGTRKHLKTWRWSSFGAYASGKAPGWLETGRVLRACQLAEGGRGLRAYAAYMEKRAKDPEGACTDESLKELRRGWYLGTDDFRDRVLDAVAKELREKRRKGSITGMAARAHDKAEAERLVKAAAGILGMPTARNSLDGRGLYADVKTLVAWLVRKRTPVTRDWVAERLVMDHPSSVSRAVRKVREEPKLGRKAKRLDKTID